MGYHFKPFQTNYHPLSDLIQLYIFDKIVIPTFLTKTTCTCTPLFSIEYSIISFVVNNIDQERV